MRHPGLTLRMMLVSTILFGFYAVLAGFLYLMGFPLVLVAAGSVVVVGVQYKLGRWLAVRSVGAEDMDEDRFREVHRMVEDLCRDMDIEKPRLMHARMGVPNAFATGRKGAGIVVVSDELMQRLDRDELEGVIAHELAHVKNRDVLTMTVGQSIAMLVGYAVQFAVLFAGDEDMGFFVRWMLSATLGTLAQLLVMLFVLAISRYREYVADEDAAEYIGGGDPLARALEKISRADHSESRVDENVSALCIFGSDKGLVQKLFATHPPMEKRIERLRS